MQSALNLRLLLATFGLVACAVLGILAYRAGYGALAAFLGAGALVAVIDGIVILKRRATRKRENPDRNYSLFE